MATVRSRRSWRSPWRATCTSRTFDLPYAVWTSIDNSDAMRGDVAADHSTASFDALADLASARVGGRVVAANDEFFAPRSNLIKPEPAIFVPGKFTTRG